MINLSYSLSFSLKQTLKEIAHLRQIILLTPLTPKNELTLKWVTKVYRLSQLTHNDQPLLTKSEISQLLTNKLKKKLTFQEQELINYQKALDYIYENWLASNADVSAKVISQLCEICSQPSFGKFKQNEQSINHLEQVINYLSHGQEHPVIKAAISFIELLSISPFPGSNEKVATLLSYLYLYKDGYDIKGFLSIEDFLIKNLNFTEQYLQKSQTNLTPWIENYSQNILKQLEKIRDKLSDQQTYSSLKYSIKLNERQKEILQILDNPEMSITNRKVQKIFRISQITASRDLTRLASFGLILVHGKGRSTYYIKL